MAYGLTDVGQLNKRDPAAKSVSIVKMWKEKKPLRFFSEMCDRPQYFPLFDFKFQLLCVDQGKINTHGE